jgi:hypothetical protein
MSRLPILTEACGTRIPALPLHQGTLFAYRIKDWETAIRQLDECAASERDFGPGKFHTLDRERLVSSQQAPSTDI